MEQNAEPVPPRDERPITATVTVSGEIASLLRDIAAIHGRTPEEMALEYATGQLKIPTTTIGESEFADWALFDGPPDLASRADEYLAEGFSR